MELTIWCGFPLVVTVTKHLTVVSLDSGTITTRGAPALACGGAAPMWRWPRDHSQLSSFSASRFGQIRRPWVLLKSVCAARRGHLYPPLGATKPSSSFFVFSSSSVLGLQLQPPSNTAVRPKAHHVGTCLPHGGSWGVEGPRKLLNARESAP